MNNPKAIPSDRPTSIPRGFVVATLILAAAFSVPLFRLGRFAAGSELYSHILLIPFISAFLVWTHRRHLPPPSAPMRAAASGMFFLSGTIVLGVWGYFAWSRPQLALENSLAASTLSFLLFFWGICGRVFAKNTLRALLLPLGFLVFMAPFPTFVKYVLEAGLQYSSAQAAYAIFKLSGTPVFFRDGLVFQLPGFNMQVAPECSGIHSTLALFITSVLAGHFFLRTRWKSAVFALAVIPLGILRNGFRVFVIGQLCVHIGPHMVDSPIHRRGGPIFFVLSLVPLFLLLYLLVRSDRRRAASGPAAAKV